MSKDELSLYTIIESIDTILLYSRSSQNADDFYHDRKSFDACMIHFINIGEMIDRLSPAFRTDHQNIPWQEIKDFRNLVAHNYFGIDAEEIWDIIENHLPVLKINIQSLL
ncbi:HepT-like ribonuclease domain-containing protein [Sulfurovum sp.]|uniref:HepT-like ribonuclease domain-containing protein n=1 Tax=Sulfurovum sp. TaxID=1969726 RepID=UPI0025F32FE3|nr:HepT-like ribonuclease domain-containing protein [Sulfurovum sp.]